jgi:copper chaperone CopZ
LDEGVEVQVGSAEVEEDSEVVENAEVMEKVGIEKAGGEDETMEDA